jgi:hypothetical protein
VRHCFLGRGVPQIILRYGWSHNGNMAAAVSRSGRFTGGHSFWLVMPGLVPGIHVFLARRSTSKTWMAGTSPRLSGLILVDEAHGMDSSVF